MLTTCPECHTSFRVGQAQLDSRRGLVRCGRCSAVFNAYDTLLPELAAPAETAGQPARVPLETVPPPRAAEPAAAEASSTPAPAQAVVQAWGDHESSTPTAPASVAPPTTGAAQAQWSESPREFMEQVLGLPQSAEPAQSQPVVEETSDSILLSELPARSPGLHPAWLDWAWGAASALLLLLFGLQLAYFLRVEIAAWWPESRPALAEACSHIGCSLPLPQDLRAVRIESSALETDPEDASRAVLRVNVSNRSSQVVAWPHLILVLTDMRDAPIAQRPFRPEEYLPAGTDPDKGMPPGREWELRLELEFKGMSAYGYKLDKQYP